MFTGIIQNVAPVLAMEKGEEQAILKIATGFTDLSLGESVAVNGICLTVAEFSKNGDATFYASPETLRCTNLGALSAASRVNLERALRVGDRLSGHWVQGHVDGMGIIRRILRDRDAFLLDVEIPEPLRKYCVDKGSISLNGTSLTINSIDAAGIAHIQLIPHTWEHTNFSSLETGHRINIEVDILAKLLERQCLYAKPSNS